MLIGIVIVIVGITVIVRVMLIAMVIVRVSVIARVTVTVIVRVRIFVIVIVRVREIVRVRVIVRMIVIVINGLKSIVIINYFDQTYVNGTVSINGRHAPPQFPPELWSVYEETLSGFARTNNHSEATTDADL